MYFVYFYHIFLVFFEIFRFSFLVQIFLLGFFLLGFFCLFSLFLIIFLTIFLTIFLIIFLYFLYQFFRCLFIPIDQNHCLYRISILSFSAHLCIIYKCRIDTYAISLLYCLLRLSSSSFVDASSECAL